jgi:hypothetical protein
LPAGLALSSEHLSDEGVYLLENGEDALIYVGGMVNPDILRELFGSPSLESVPSQVIFCMHFFVAKPFSNDKELSCVIFVAKLSWVISVQVW